MERPKSPWEPSEAVIELEFQRRALEDIHSFVRKFAKENDITYLVEKEPDTLSIIAQEGNFDALRAHTKEVVNTLNETLKHHKKTFLFAVDDRVKRLTVRATAIHR